MFIYFPPSKGLPTSQIVWTTWKHSNPKCRALHQNYHGLTTIFTTLKWVAAWIIFNNCFSVPGDSLDNLEETSEEIRLAFFPPYMDTRCLLNFMREFSRMTSRVPKPQRQPSSGLNLLWENLLEYYQKVELTLLASLDLDASGYDIYSTFKEVFTVLRDATPNYLLILILELRAEVAKLKRDRGELTDEGQLSTKRRIW